jgi:hypothetical protein
MIALAVKLLSALGLTEKAAKTIAPLALIAVLGLGLWLIRHDAYVDGQRAIKAEMAEKVAEAREKERALYQEREKITLASYTKFLEAAAETRSQAPQIIERIRNVPVAECLREPANPELYRLYVNSIIGAGAADSRLGG